MNLLPLISESENLRHAFINAARGKRDRQEVTDFSARLDENLAALRDELISGDVAVGDYHFFRVYDPKERLICAASFRERVLHHAMMNICEPVFERYAIYDTYACRPDKGLHRALTRAQGFARQHSWFLKLDIRKYFDSIDHVTLLQSLDRLFRDKRLITLFQRIVDSYETAPGRGLPIGNLLSQHFANFYLGAMDHWLKETRQIAGYLRYMDDFVLFADSREQLKNELNHIREFLDKRLKLTLKEPTHLNRTVLGVPMLGFRVSPGRILLTSRSRRRFVTKLRHYEQEATSGRLDQRELARRVTSLVSFTKAADAAGFRRQVIGQGATAIGVPTASYAAAAGTIRPVTSGRLTVTTTTRPTATTTTASGLFSPQLTGQVESAR
jgi:retron-type reverse transcriptase